MMQKNKAKKFFTFTLTIALILCFSTGIFAIEINAVTPRWTNIVSINLAISFDGNEGNVSAIVVKQSSATSVEGTVTLYELVDDQWVYIDEWYNSKSRGTLVVGGDFVCESGVTYKAVFVVTAYSGSTPETATEEYIAECP